MKQLLPLLALVCFAFPVFAQLNNQQSPEEAWDHPEFEKRYVQAFDLEAIHLLTYEGNNRHHARRKPNSVVSIRFDENGNKVYVIETHEEDTARIKAYHYTERGILGWEETKDRVWQKTYRAGYRFNTKKEVYQVKSYEMLNEDQAMLLGTRHYVYDNDSLLIAIRYYQNGQIDQITRFEYDAQRRVAREYLEGFDGQIFQDTRFTYDPKGNKKEVVQVKGEKTQTFRYSYDEMGRQTALEWLENGQQAGIVNYTYDDQGMLIRMDREIVKEGQPRRFVQVVEYERSGQIAAEEESNLD